MKHNLGMFTDNTLLLSGALFDALELSGNTKHQVVVWMERESKEYFATVLIEPKNLKAEIAENPDQVFMGIVSASHE